MEVVFHFTNNQVNGSIEEIIDLPEDTPDSEIDELFNDWLYERSKAVWYKKEE